MRIWLVCHCSRLSTNGAHLQRADE
jgi:hypothetical protein